MNFKVTKPTFLKSFDEPFIPSRPPKGGVIKLKSGQDYEPSILDKLIPHPVYGWMNWVSVINPSKKTIEALLESGLVDESYFDAVKRHDKNKIVINRCNGSSVPSNRVINGGNFFEDSLPAK